MLILGIETSTKTGSIALVSETGVIAQYSLNIEVTHSERLMSTVDRVLRDTGLAIAGVDAYAVATGPGSFTGLRIGMATVKGLALVTGKPVAAVSTLAALAWNLPLSEHPVCPLLDARKNEVYAGVYLSDGMSLAEIKGDAVVPLSRLADMVSGNVIFAGEGSLLYRTELEAMFGGRCRFAPRSACLPSAASVAEIGLSMIENGVHAEPETLAPTYLRRPEAEVAWEKKNRSR